MQDDQGLAGPKGALLVTSWLAPDQALRDTSTEEQKTGGLKHMKAFFTTKVIKHWKRFHTEEVLEKFKPKWTWPQAAHAAGTWTQDLQRSLPTTAIL